MSVSRSAPLAGLKAVAPAARADPQQFANISGASLHLPFPLFFAYAAGFNFVVPELVPVYLGCSFALLFNGPGRRAPGPADTSSVVLAALNCQRSAGPACTSARTASAGLGPLRWFDHVQDLRL